jgi:hypothetical protein
MWTCSREYSGFMDDLGQATDLLRTTKRLREYRFPEVGLLSASATCSARDQKSRASRCCQPTERIFSASGTTLLPLQGKLSSHGGRRPKSRSPPSSVSSSYRQGRESGIVRFCFAKQDPTLAMALERLARL